MSSNFFSTEGLTHSRVKAMKILIHTSTSSPGLSNVSIQCTRKYVTNTPMARRLQLLYSEPYSVPFVIIIWLFII